MDQQPRLRYAYTRADKCPNPKAIDRKSPLPNSHPPPALPLNRTFWIALGLTYVLSLCLGGLGRMLIVFVFEGAPGAVLFYGPLIWAFWFLLMGVLVSPLVMLLVTPVSLLAAWLGWRAFAPRFTPRMALGLTASLAAACAGAAVMLVIWSDLLGTYTAGLNLVAFPVTIAAILIAPIVATRLYRTWLEQAADDVTQS